jgi:putative transcriptional regulator
MTYSDIDTSFLEGDLLIAMPTMSDPRFAKSVIFVCSHSENGAMGIVVNKVSHALTFTEMLDQLEIPYSETPEDIRLYSGGPVETERGFVLHSTDMLHETSMMIDENVALTATVDMLKLIASGEGPDNSFLALGYAGWGPGQLEAEIQENGWLVVKSDPELLFDSEVTGKWQKAIHKLGVDPALLSSDVGHA